MTNHLLIFTRYPKPGKTKTRLIPAVGPEGAATIQRELTEHTIQTVRSLQARLPELVSTVFYTGTTQQQMAAWLGSDLQYRPQGEGNLGQRMQASFQAAFAMGAKRVVIIGIDCPELAVTDLEQAFIALSKQAIVFGPATDGGYYLLGQQHLVPELFVNVEWGTDQVLAQSLAIATQLNLTVQQLRPLTDIDRPADLPLWEQLRG
ncbi:MAG: TIGR04282 family arsenosugar biosynthesis glycosyltransferase [Cyanobacteria bacterium P01_H01_bin.121]